jgi:two-component system, OmpR family, osmolarity sensor histidine kinase EnvZ
MATASPRFMRRWLIPRTLFGRSLLIVLLPLLILQAVITVVFYERHWATVTRWLGAGLAGEVAMIVEELGEAPDSGAYDRVLDRARRHLDLVIGLEPGGELGPAMEAAGFRPLGRANEELLETFGHHLHHPFAIDLRPDEERRIAVYVQLEDGLLRVLAPRKRVETTTTNLLMLWMVGVSALLILVALYFLSRQVRPIRRLAAAADSFGKGRDIGDFKLEGALEIRRAGLAFNLMRERILRQISQRTEMLAAVSHDLRTPLTRMRLELEMLARSRGLDAGTAQAVADLEADVEEMGRLVDAYLAFARGDGREAAQTVDLGELLQEMVERARRDGLVVELDMAEPIQAQLRPLAFRRCLQNLIDNARRHARHARIAARADEEMVEVVVDDDGPGIPPARREEAFKAFFRLDPSRNPDTGGLGLGLTIARDVVHGHGGEIRLEDAPQGGLRVRMRLPR